MSEFPFASRSSVGTWAIYLFFVGVCAVLVAITIYTQNKRVTLAATSIAPRDKTAAVITAKPPVERNYRLIAQWHLFDKPSVAVPTTIPQPDEQLVSVPIGRLPVSDMKLSLTGVVHSADGDTTFAIVQHGPGKDKTYAAGDTLPGEVQLHKIDTTRIVVRRNGRFEEVALPQWGDGRNSPSSQKDTGKRVSSRPQVPTERALEMAVPES